MGSFGILHWVIVIAILSFPLILVVFIRRILRRSGRNASVAQRESSSSHETSESRLLRLDGLLKKGLITRAEHERQRSAIIAGV